MQCSMVRPHCHWVVPHGVCWRALTTVHVNKSLSFLMQIMVRKIFEFQYTTGNMFGRQNIDITIYCHAFTYPEPPFFRFRGDLSKKSKIATCGYKRKIASFFRKLQNRRNTSRHFDSNLQIIKILSKITIFFIDNSRLMLQIVTPILLFN